MNILTVENNNNSIKTTPALYVAAAEQHYKDQISAVAKHLIAIKSHQPIILISGPSGSGKTTTAQRLSVLLNEMGCPTCTLSMDNYFLPLHDKRNQVDENGKIDLESPKRLDIDFFNSQLQQILDCEEITLPVFDFVKQQRFIGAKFQRKFTDCVIIEGIHALNPEVTGAFHGKAVKVYVSVRTRIQNNEDVLLHPSKIRLMRRLMRDKLFRGRDVTDTFEFFKLVQRGERRYIMPHKSLASFDIDTFMSYEASVYRNFLLPELAAVKDTYADYNSYRELEEFLSELSPLSVDMVPKSSLIREFVG